MGVYLGWILCNKEFRHLYASPDVKTEKCEQQLAPYMGSMEQTRNSVIPVPSAILRSIGW
jgi:hypothetical protein